MKKSTEDQSRAAPTGRKYNSVAALMQGEEIPKDVQDKVFHLIAESRVATQMAQLRHRSGITQKQMADALKVTQSAISKLEAGKDDNITLNHVKEYARITGDRIHLMFGKPFTHTEAVRIHADGLKFRLEKLAEIASQNIELQSEIKGFLGDAFYNLFNIITLCTSKLPVNADDNIEEIRIEIITGKNVTPANGSSLRPKCEKEVSAVA
jgi:transcriptional regulator with XRE-family HTH domain